MTQNRQQPGTPTGGQFATTPLSPSTDVDLGSKGSVNPDIVDAMKAAGKARAALAAHEDACAMKAASRYVRSIHPTAHQIRLEPLGDHDAYEERHFRVESINDINGVELATGADEDLDNLIGCLEDDGVSGGSVPYEDQPEDAAPWTTGYSYIPIEQSLAYDHTQGLSSVINAHPEAN